VRTATWSDRTVTVYAWVVVALRLLVPPAWIAAAVLSWMWLPPLGGTAQSPLGDIVPERSPALAAQEKALRLFGSTVLADTLVVQRDPGGLEPAEGAGLARGAADVARGRQRPDLALVRGAVPLVNAPVAGVRWGEDRTTALTYLLLAPEASLIERDAAARRFVDRYARSAPGTSIGVTGPGPARLAQYAEIEDVLPWVEAATVAVILLVVAVYFRSPGAPLVTLFTAAIAYVVAVRTLAWSGERAGVTVPREIEPILVVLLLGLATDYTIFFMSEARRRLARGEPRVRAARPATMRIVPIVASAGILVAGGAAALMAGKLEFFRVFGPGMALSALVVTLVCVTLVPALLGLVGPWLFGRRVRQAEPAADETTQAGTRRARNSRRRERWRRHSAGIRGSYRVSRRLARDQNRAVLPLFGTRVLTARPVAVVVAAVCIATLAIAAGGARSIDLGVSFVHSLPADSEPRRAADDAARGFLPGIVSPSELIFEQPGIGRRLPQLARLQTAVARERGVALVLGPREEAVLRSPSFAVARGGGAARLAVILDEDASGARGIADFDALRDRMPALLREAGLPPGVRVSYGGESALASDTVDAIGADLRRIAAAALLITFVLLALFLRALVAPLLLLLAGALGVAASFGLTALVLPEAAGGGDLVYYVPLVAVVLLVALGCDYNVFIARQIREEARRRRMRDAIAAAAPAASRAITAAGITLAGTFALLALVPLRPFRELALLMSIGVLVDALLVRPLLIPSFLAVAGERSWWPGRSARPAAAKAFLQQVALRSGQSMRDARRMTEATLQALGERLTRRQATELARHLPPQLASAMKSRGGGEPLTRDEFIRRVADRSGTSTRSAREEAGAVLATLTDALSETEVEHLRAALSEDYLVLFGDDPAPEDRRLATPAAR
jgi:putative drug exporter of the RND superfamily